MTPTTTDAEESSQILPFDSVDDSELGDVWWTRWSLLTPDWQGYKRSMLQANFLKGYLLRGLRTSARETPFIPGTLERFLGLPVELVFEVLNHLHALDLYHLSLTSRAFERMLHEPTAYPIWRNAFSRIAEFPPCPPSLTQTQWAALMFGPVRCEDCGRFGAQPDIALFKNFCGPCTEKHFVSKQDIMDMFSSHPDPRSTYARFKAVCQSRCRLVTLQLRQRTSSEKRSEKRFLREDVERAIPYILKEIELETSGGEALVNGVDPVAWRKQQVVNITRTNEHMMLTLRWVVSVLTDLQEEHRKRASACLNRCRQRITNMRLGYTSDDIRYAVSSDWKTYIQGLGVQRMTRKDFRSHKPFLISAVRKRAMTRLKVARTLEIMTLCETFRSSLTPPESQHHPPAAQLMDAECFREYIGQDVDYATEYPSAVALAKLPVISREWTESRREDLALKWMLESDIEAIGLDKAKAELRLAQAVFLCPQCKVHDQKWKTGPALCGWVNAHKHMCHVTSDRHQTLQFSEKGRGAVTELLKRLGLDPDTTTAETLDEMDLRFVCDGCELSARRKGILGKEVYTWSEYVTHALQHEDRVHSSLASALGPEATQFVKDHERKANLANVDPWGCAHCSEHLDYSVTLPRAIAHVKKVHNISPVVRNKDVIHFSNRYSLTDFKQRKPFIYSFEPLHNMVCKCCPSMSVCVLWDRVSLKAHLRTKHGISEPVDDVDWTTIRVIIPPGTLPANADGDVNT